METESTSEFRLYSDILCTVNRELSIKHSSRNDHITDPRIFIFS